jgi:hypothetical protein
MEARTISQADQSPLSVWLSSTASTIAAGLSQSATLAVVYCLLSNLGLIVYCYQQQAAINCLLLSCQNRINFN